MVKFTHPAFKAAGFYAKASRLPMMLVLFTASVLCSCTKDKDLPDTGIIPVESGEVSGFYILNQGGYGSNNATLDYVDLATGQYHTGYFESRNPDMAYGLGDTGNDIFISGGLLFIIMNGSGIVEIASADDAKHIAQVEVPNCRYGTVSDGYLYVTSYASEGTLYKISLADYKVVATLKTGYEPEQLLCLDGFLYILNSGGYHSPEYDDTITVVDLSGFSVDRTVDTGYRNLYKILYADGTIYVTSRGDYNEDPGAVFIFDPETDGITPVLDKPVSNWSYFNGTVYTQSTIYDDSWNETAMFGKITGGTFSESGFAGLSGITLKSCYCLDINPATGDFVISDAGDHKAEGTVYYFNADGSLAWKHTAGVAPAKVCWTLKKDNI